MSCFLCSLVFSPHSPLFVDFISLYYVCGREYCLCSLAFSPLFHKFVPPKQTDAIVLFLMPELFSFIWSYYYPIHLVFLGFLFLYYACGRGFSFPVRLYPCIFIQSKCSQKAPEAGVLLCDAGVVFFVMMLDGIFVFFSILSLTNVLISHMFQDGPPSFLTLFQVPQTLLHFVSCSTPSNKAFVVRSPF